MELCQEKETSSTGHDSDNVLKDSYSQISKLLYVGNTVGFLYAEDPVACKSTVTSISAAV